MRQGGSLGAGMARLSPGSKRQTSDRIVRAGLSRGKCGRRLFVPRSLPIPFPSRVLLVNLAAMDFQTVLKEVVENTEGGLATLLMDFEGIPVDSYSKDDTPFDINTIGIEFSIVLKAIQRAAQMLEAGDTAEVAIQAEKVTTLIRVVSDSYFVAFSLMPDANFGKARYMLRTRVPLIRKELA